MSHVNVIEFPRAAGNAKDAERPRDVLFVGDEGEKEQGRAIRSRTGLRVRSVEPGQAEAWARSAAKHVWVFCATMDYSRMVYLASSVRRYSPGSRLLLVKEQAGGFEKALFDEVLRTPGNAEAIASAVKRLAAG
jgi:hypothetical protein